MYNHGHILACSSYLHSFYYYNFIECLLEFLMHPFSINKILYDHFKIPNQMKIDNQKE